MQFQTDVFLQLTSFNEACIEPLIVTDYSSISVFSTLIVSNHLIIPLCDVTYTKIRLELFLHGGQENQQNLV